MEEYLLKRWALTIRMISLLLILVLTLYSANSFANREEILLPEIGDPADTVLSSAEEQKLGTVILGQIRSSLNVVNDPELDTYIQSLGTRLITAGLDSNIDFTFLMIADPSINAFATPGGIVAIFSGLMIASENESELAGVVAHEIAHVSQRHLARAYANASKINIATAIGVLAAIAGGIYNPQLGSAALSSTLAAGAQSQLAFSRANEQEADRIGLVLLAQANFDPMGMPRFFERLQKKTQASAGPLVEFLSTHPVTLSRISDTKGRAAQYEGPFVKDSKRFQFAKARMIALTSNPSSLISYYDRASKKGKRRSLTETYAYAVALTRNGQASRAVTLLSRLKESEKNSIFVNLALVQAHLAADQYRIAIPMLERLDQIYPNQEAIVYYLAQGLIDSGQPRKALTKLESLSRHERQNPYIDSLIAKAAASADLPWLSHEAMADYYMAYGQYNAAMDQFELALRQNDIDAIAQARIRSKRKQLREINKKK